MTNKGAQSTGDILKCGRETLAFTGQKANHDVTLVPSQHNPLTLWEVLIWWVYISTAVKDFCSTTHTNWILTTKPKPPWIQDNMAFFLGTSTLVLSRVLGKNFKENSTLLRFTLAVTHSILSSFRFLSLATLSWKHSLYGKLEQSVGCKQIIAFVMWKTLASLSGIFPLKTTFEVELVGAPPQDSHPPIPSACTVSAQRTTSWGEERNRQQCLLELENWLHNLNFSLTTVLLH